MPLREPGFDQELQVTGDAGLRLSEDVREVGDRELALGQEGQDPQARLLRGGPKDIQGQIQRWRRGVSARPNLALTYKDMFISFLERSKRTYAFPRPCAVASPARRRRHDPKDGLAVENSDQQGERFAGADLADMGDAPWQSRIPGEEAEILAHQAT